MIFAIAVRVEVLKCSFSQVLLECHVRHLSSLDPLLAMGLMGSLQWCKYYLDIKFKSDIPVTHRDDIRNILHCFGGPAVDVSSMQGWGIKVYSVRFFRNPV